FVIVRIELESRTAHAGHIRIARGRLHLERAALVSPSARPRSGAAIAGRGKTRYSRGGQRREILIIRLHLGVRRIFFPLPVTHRHLVNAELWLSRYIRVD